MDTTMLNPNKHLLEVEGGRIAYTTHGSPAHPPILLVHGWLMHGGNWKHTVALLQAHYYCVVPDLLGLGDSDKPADGDYSILAQARRVLALADALGLARFSLIGHSMGAQIVLALAAVLAPERVERVVDVSGVVSGSVLVAPGSLTMRRMYLAEHFPWMWSLSAALSQRFAAAARVEFRHWFHDTHANPMALWADDMRYALRPELHATALRCYEALTAFDVTPYLPQLAVPVLVIFGWEDAVVSLREGELAAALIPDSTLVRIEQCGHFPMYEQPEAYFAALAPFFGVPAASAVSLRER